MNPQIKFKKEVKNKKCLDENPGFGLGLRSAHYQELFRRKSEAQWFEAITENYLGLRGSGAGRGLEILRKIRESYPIALHGVSLSLGGTDPLSHSYLEQLEDLIDQIEPLWVSDHLCWTRHGGHHLHDLLPLPYTKETVVHVAERIDAVQTKLRRRILVENVSSYVEFECSEMDEAEFLREVSLRADCDLLLDINNIFVSAVNHSISIEDYLKKVPLDRVKQIHLAGHSTHQHYRVDTHDHPVCDEVWQWYRRFLEMKGSVATMIERDDSIPPLESLEAELRIAKRIAHEVFESPAVMV